MFGRFENPKRGMQAPSWADAKATKDTTSWKNSKSKVFKSAPLG